MIFRLSGILALSIFMAVAANCETPADELAARQATAEHQYVQARGIYKHLAAEHPDNAAYQVWIGRLSGYLGDLNPALAAYNQGLTLDPQNLEALVGKAYILLWMHHYDEAAAIISRAQEMAPESIDVNLASARRYIYVRQYDLAMKSLARVLEVDPKNQEALDLKAVIQPPGSLRLEVGGLSEHLANASTGGAGVIAASWITSVNSIGARFEEWRRFDKTASRGSVQFSHTFQHRWIASASTTVSSRGDILARYGNFVSLNRKLPAGWVLGAQYRDLIFDSAHIRFTGPQAEYYFERPIWVDGNYLRVWSSIQIPGLASPLVIPSSSEFIRYHERIRRWTVHFGYAHGAEYFAIPVVAQLGQFTANSFLAGVDIPTSKKWTTHVDYIQARRSNGNVEQIVSLGWIYRGGQ